MAAEVRVPRIRLLVMWLALFGLCCFFSTWAAWNELSIPSERRIASSLILSFSLLFSGMVSWVVARHLKPARMTLPLSLEASFPLIVSAAPRMKHTVERLETGEIVLRNDRSILGTHPTIVVRPASAAIRITGPAGEIARLGWLLTGQRRKPDWEPSPWEVVIALLLGMLLVLTAVLSPFQSCASIDVPTSGPWSVLGSSMRRLCDLWGPIVPATIGALGAMVPFSYAALAWREYRKRKTGATRVAAE